MENIKDDRMTIRVSDEERIRIVDAAMEREKTISQLFRNALDVYLAFPLALMGQIKKANEGLNIEPEEIIPRLLLVYIATDAAIIKNFGVSKTYERAFRFGEDGKLLLGDDLSKNTFEEVDKVCKEVLKKMKWIAKGKETLLSKEEGSYVPMLQEAKYARTATAKSK